MNKKLIAAFIATIISIPTAANAALKNQSMPQPTLAILDTALDTSLPMFKDRLVYEACVTEWSTCPNGLGVMEGTGASTMQSDWISKNGFEHGTQMASLAVATDPNVKIVFVRIIGANSKGYRQATSENTVVNALSWVIANQAKYNIQAVSMSQGHHNLTPYKEYCPVTTNTTNKIKDLASIGVPVFVPAGNLRDYSRVSWPGCISEAVTISATMPTKEIAFYTNYDPLKTDFFALGTTRAFNPGGKLVNVAGTSASTVIAATNWVSVKTAKPYLTYSQVYDLLSRTSTATKNSKINGGKLIDVVKAINE